MNVTKNVGRTAMSVRNVSATLINRIITLVLNFLGRTVFIHTLGTQYLGLGGLFGNIFSVISLCELGVGAAITQSLYKPIAQNDELRVAQIINYFTRVYNIIAVVTALLSAAVIPFLPIITKGEEGIRGLCGIYVLFSLHSVVSYLLAPKRTLIICDQRLYVVTVIRTVSSIVIFALQIAILKACKDYILYISARIVLLTVEGILINNYADKKYKFLKLRGFPDSEYKKRLRRNVRALMLHKTGGVLTHSTDSILISACLGLQCMGKYSNYALVVGSVGTLVDIAMNAVSASVGNLGATSDRKKSEIVMRRLYFLNFWLLTICSAVLVCALNPVIELWIGKEMLFGLPEVAVIVGSFYASCIRDPVQIFLQSYGIFHQSRFMPPARALVNLVLSVLFIKAMGITGVFLGTVASVVAVPLWCEPYLLYKYGFKLKMNGFGVEMTGYILDSVILCAVSAAVTYNFPVNLVWTGARIVTAFCIVNLAVILRYSNTKQYCGMMCLVKSYLLKRGQ